MPATSPKNSTASKNKMLREKVIFRFDDIFSLGASIRN